jgi:hypothetical protein
LTIDMGARKLTPVSGNRLGLPLQVHFLSGAEHWAMTAFCLSSLLRSTSVNLVPIVLDDGTLGPAQKAELTRIFAEKQFVDREESEKRVQHNLPRTSYPSLHAMRDELPLMRKLIDLHIAERGWRLFLDSDILFFREPQWILNWLQSPRSPFYMRDFRNSYGYREETIAAAMGQPVLPLVNTGLYGFESNSIDWDRLERWAGFLHSAAGTNHFSEQCLLAMLMTTSAPQQAPSDYLIWPSEQEVRNPSAVMHHYVAESRTWYYIHGWPDTLRRSRD